jgi:hypothetical protein
MPMWCLWTTFVGDPTWISFSFLENIPLTLPSNPLPDDGEAVEGDIGAFVSGTIDVTVYDNDSISIGKA